MSYLVLARKYRPRNFEDVIGQEVVTRVLTGALDEGRLGHAYLFSGPRGTGKTTIARILAKSLNCESGPSSKPCGTCESCLSADDGSAVDIIELDAASHTGVDTIRELRDEASYAPMRARTKVYIIDEVHMLSKGAFNALLKTLEEPPPHVVFLFATTEQHKVLDTILSRCQILRLQPLAQDAIAERLAEVFRQEGVTPGAGVVEELARSARGGMRDALSSADKLLALSGDEPTLEDLRRLGGDGGARAVEELAAKIEEGDKAGVLGALAGFDGGDAELVAGLLDHLRRALVLAHCGETTPLVAGGEEERRNALELARRLGPERVEVWMQELLRARERMRLLPGQERLVLEVALLDLCRRENTAPLSEWVERLEDLEARRGGSDEDAQQPPAELIEPAPRAPAVPRRPTSPPAEVASSPSPAAEDAPEAPAALWSALLEALGASHGALADLLSRRGRLREEHGAFVIELDELEAAEQRLAKDKRNQNACRRTFSRVAGGAKVELVVGGGGAPKDGGAPRPRARKDEKRSRGSGKDEFTSEVADLFGGAIEDLT